MKSILKYFVPMTAAVVALAACNKVKESESKVPAKTEATLHITVKATPDDINADADDDADTKTYIDNKTIKWGTDEYMKIGVFDGTATAWGKSSDETADVWAGDSEGYFSFEITPQNETDDYTYYGLYPFSAAVTSDNTNPASYKVNLPASQNATAASYDPSAYILVARPEAGKSAASADWEAAFRRATALNKVTLQNIPEDIKRITITAPDGVYMAGERNINLTTGMSANIYAGTNTIEINYETALSGTNKDVWFTSWNTTIPVESQLLIVAYSETHSFTREITVTTKPITFKEGYLNTLNVNMTPGTKSTVELLDGNYLVLAKHGTDYYAMRAEDTGNDQLVSVTYEGSLTSFYGDAIMIWSIEKTEGSYTVMNSTNYLGWKNNKNSASLIEDTEFTAEACLMDITYDEWTSGVWSDHITNHNTTDRTLARNSNNSFFAFYGNGDQYDDLIFVPATVDTRTVVTLSFAEASVGKTTSNYSEFTGQTATADPNVSAITSKISYSMTGDAIGTVNASNGTVSLNGEKGTATVTATFAGDATYRGAQSSYTIIVSADSGPQYEKVTSLSNVTNGEYIIVNDDYYLPNTAASNAGPAKVEVIIASNKVQSVVDAMKWTFTGESTNAMTIQSKANTSNYLYVSGNGNGNIRVGASDHTWTIDNYSGTAGAFTLKDNTNNRYCATYGNGSDWRSYNTYNAANYADGGRVYLYKLVDNRGDSEISWSAPSAIATYTTGNTLSFTAPNLNLGNLGSIEGITFESTDENIATISEAGVVAIKALTDNDVKEGDTTIKAIFEGDDDYKGKTVTYTLSVVDARDPVATPTFSPAAGEVVADTEVTISYADGATVYYTVDNSTPTSSSTEYTGTITIDVAKTIKAIATKTGYKPSAVAEASYTITGVSTTIADVISGGVGSYEVSDVLVYAVKGNGLILGDGTAFIYAYKSGHGLNVGDVRTVNGTTQMYQSEVYQFNNPTFSGSGTSTVDHGTPVEFNENADDLQTSFTGAGNVHTAVYVHATGTQSGRNITTAGGDVLYLSAVEAATDGQSVEVYGYVYAYSSSHNNFNFLATSIGIDPSVPSLTTTPASGSTLTWADDEYGASNAKTITVTQNGAATGYTVSSASAAWTVSDNGTGTITVYPNAANESTTDDKTLDVTITHKDNGALTSTITLKQTKQSGGGGGDTPDPIVLNAETSGFRTGSYGTANAFDDATLEGYSFKIQQVYVNGDKLQWRASGNKNGTGIMYNADAMPAGITSIVIVYNSSDTGKNHTVKIGSSANPTSSSTITPSVSGSTYTFAGDGSSTYFVITNGSGAGYIDSITINFD